MNNFVITIARGFGSGGKEIATKLGERLGIPCYERQILTLASDKSGIDESLFVDSDEKLRSNKVAKLLHKIPFSNVLEPHEKAFVSDTNLFNIQAEIIRELARTESCIIVGKCADFVLKDSFDNRYHVYKKNVFNSEVGIGYIGSCEIKNDKYLFQGEKFDTPEELCEAFKEHANTLPFPIALFDQSLRQSSQLAGIFDYYLKTVLGFSDLDSKNYFLAKGCGYCKTIGETKLEIHVLSDIVINSSVNDKITIFYKYHNFFLKILTEGFNFKIPFPTLSEVS